MCLKEPLRALSEAILVTPTVVKLSPLPEQQIIGDLSEEEAVLQRARIAPKGEQMNATTVKSDQSFPNHFEANEMALSLAQAEETLRAYTSDQVDAVVGADGKPYLLRPAQETCFKTSGGSMR